MAADFPCVFWGTWNYREYYEGAEYKTFSNVLDLVGRHVLGDVQLGRRWPGTGARADGRKKGAGL